MNSFTNKIYIGLGSCGRAAGAARVREKVLQWVAQRTIDVDVVSVGCLGLCYLEPILDVQPQGKDRVSYGRVSPSDVGFILDETFVRGNFSIDGIVGTYSSESTKGSSLPSIYDVPFLAGQQRNIMKNSGIIDPTSLGEYRKTGGFASLSTLCDMKRADMRKIILREFSHEIDTLGSGSNSSPTIVCSAHGDDPIGRVILEGDPFSMIEGILIACYAWNTHRSVILHQMESAQTLDTVRSAASAARDIDIPVLTSNKRHPLSIDVIPGTDETGFDGTATIHGLMGKRGIPDGDRLDRPGETSDHPNFLVGSPEMFVSIARYFASLDISHLESGSGMVKTVVYRLAGHINRPGWAEAPAETTLHDLIFTIGGGIPDERAFKAAFVGRTTGAIVPRDYLETSVTSHELRDMGLSGDSGGITVFDDRTCMVDAVSHIQRLIAESSCGACAPCREGTAMVSEALRGVTTSYTAMSSEEQNLSRFTMAMRLENTAEVIRDASRCRYGKTASSPVLSLIRHFREEYAHHVFERSCPNATCAGLST